MLICWIHISYQHTTTELQLHISHLKVTVWIVGKQLQFFDEVG